MNPSRNFFKKQSERKISFHYINREKRKNTKKGKNYVNSVILIPIPNGEQAGNRKYFRASASEKLIEAGRIRAQQLWIKNLVQGKFSKLAT